MVEYKVGQIARQSTESLVVLTFFNIRLTNLEKLGVASMSLDMSQRELTNVTSASMFIEPTL
jgi:hypothetical protein